MTSRVFMIAYTEYLWDARVRREAETLALHQYNVTILVPRLGDRAQSFEIDKVKVVEVNVKQYRGKRRYGYFLSYFRFLAVCIAICAWRCLKREIDIIHVHNMPNFLVFAACIPRLMGKKVILDVHDTMPETYAAKFGDDPRDTDGEKAGGGKGLAFRLFCLEEAICCKLAHRIICVNHTQKDAMVERGIPEHKISVSLNVPDHRRFGMNGASSPSEAGSSASRIVYHGTLARRLGVDLAIRAVAQIAQTDPNIEFHVLGSGDDEQEFVELSRSLGVENRVLFKGFVPIDGLVSALRGMEIGVIPNRKNLATQLMLPVKMMEYIALGIPVAVPRLKAILRYFTEDMVRFYQAEDVEDLARAIRELQGDSGLRARQVERAREFLERYGWERHQEDLLELYSSVADH